MNNLNITGRLGRDCEIKALPTGTTLCEFPVAFDSGFGDRKTSTWVLCKIWGKRAEGGLPQYLIKGQQVAISGELSNRTYDKQDGSKGYSLELNVNTIDLIGGKQEGQGQGQGFAPAQQPQTRTPPAGYQQGAASGDRSQAPPTTDFDDDIPF